MPLTILIADQEPIARYGTMHWLKKMFGNATIHIAEDFATLNKILHKNQVDLLLYDLRMSDFNSYETIKRIRQTRKGIRIIVFSWQPEELYATRFLKAGVYSYLSKSCEFEKFQATVLAVCSGKKHKPYKATYSNNGTISKLSNRELEICKLLSKGNNLISISKQLCIHESSVSTYRSRIYRKLGIKSIIELIGLVEKAIPGWQQVQCGD
jgi:DNA-binding NarL/FixJ family response regulator